MAKTHGRSNIRCNENRSTADGRDFPETHAYSNKREMSHATCALRIRASSLHSFHAEQNMIQLQRTYCDSPDRNRWCTHTHYLVSSADMPLLSSFPWYKIRNGHLTEDRMVTYKLNIAAATKTNGVMIGDVRQIYHVELWISKKDEKGHSISWPETATSCSNCGHHRPVGGQFGDGYITRTNTKINFDIDLGDQGKSIVAHVKEQFKATQDDPCIAVSTSVLRITTTFLRDKNQSVASQIAEAWSMVWGEYFLGANRTIDIILHLSREDRDKERMIKFDNDSNGPFVIKLRTFTMPNEKTPFKLSLEHCCLDIINSEHGNSLGFSMHPCKSGRFDMKCAESSEVNYHPELQCQLSVPRDKISLKDISPNGQLRKNFPDNFENTCQVSMIVVLRNIKQMLKFKDVHGVTEFFDHAIGVVCDMNLQFQRASQIASGLVIPVVLQKQDLPGVVAAGIRDSAEVYNNSYWPKKMFQD